MGLGLPLTLPLAVVALMLASFRPGHVNEATDPVDNLGGILSVVLVAALILAINFAPCSRTRARSRSAWLRSRSRRSVAFLLRQRRAPNPLYDLHVAGRRVFWVAACAGVIVFGTLMGAMFIGQQFLQNVLGYSTLEAGARSSRRRPHGARRAALGEAGRGARRRLTLLVGYAFCLLGFLAMLLLWNEDISVLEGRSRLHASSESAWASRGTPASHSLTGSVPVTRAGMASGTADLQRDLGGAIMQSILGALLGRRATPSAVTAAIAASPEHDVTDSVESQLTKSFAGPRTSPASIRSTRTRSSPERGVVPRRRGLGLYRGHRGDPPRRRRLLPLPEADEEKRLLAEYHAEDTSTAPGTAAATRRA